MRDVRASQTCCEYLFFPFSATFECEKNSFSADYSHIYLHNATQATHLNFHNFLFARIARITEFQFHLGIVVRISFTSHWKNLSMLDTAASDKIENVEHCQHLSSQFSILLSADAECIGRMMMCVSRCQTNLSCDKLFSSFDFLNIRNNPFPVAFIAICVISLIMKYSTLKQTSSLIPSTTEIRQLRRNLLLLCQPKTHSISRNGEWDPIDDCGIHSKKHQLVGDRPSSISCQKRKSKQYEFARNAVRVSNATSSSNKLKWQIKKKNQERIPFYCVAKGGFSWLQNVRKPTQKTREQCRMCGTMRHKRQNEEIKQAEQTCGCRKNDNVAELFIFLVQRIRARWAGKGWAGVVRIEFTVNGVNVAYASVSGTRERCHEITWQNVRVSSIASTMKIEDNDRMNALGWRVMASSGCDLNVNYICFSFCCVSAVVLCDDDAFAQSPT